MNVLVVNENKLENFKKKIKEEGSGKFHVVADFDRTLTYGLDKNGKRTTTVISQLRSDSDYLGQDYFNEAHRLFEEYHPIEVDSNFDLEEKKEKMNEWWRKHFALIAEAGLTKDLIKRVVKEKQLKFRNGCLDFINFLKEKMIPLVIMSAAPGDMIVEYLEQNDLMTDNVFVIANRYEFDENGNALKIKEPIIHTFNKQEISLEGTEIYEKVKDRKNVLLLGDSLGDIGMIDGFDYDNLIKIGFLNQNVEENLENYKINFDVVILNDTDFGFINELVEGMLK